MPETDYLIGFPLKLQVKRLQNGMAVRQDPDDQTGLLLQFLVFRDNGFRRTANQMATVQPVLNLSGKRRETLFVVMRDE